MTLPTNFTPQGLLPPGDYPLTSAELRASLLVHGPPGRSARRWDVERRLWLIDNLAIMAGHLWRLGIHDIFLNGSFVEEKASPNDIDGYFYCPMSYFRMGHLQRDLQQLDPVWTWVNNSRTKDPNSTKLQLPMWHKYRVELWPEAINHSGIKGSLGEDLPFSAAFRQRRTTYEQKGIIQLVQVSGTAP